MKLSLAARLALSSLAIILLGMALTGPLAWLAVEQLYLNTQRASLLAQAQLVASALAGQVPAGGTPGAYSQTSNVLPGLHIRLIDPQGGAVIELAAPGLPVPTIGLTMPELAQNAAGGTVTAEELLARPEITQAQQGQPATAIRRLVGPTGSGSERDVLYAAAPVVGPDGSVSQIVYLATPLPDTSLAALPEAVRWQFAGVLMAAAALAGLAGWLLSRRIARPLARLAGAAQAVATGDLTQSVPEDPGIRELAGLGQAFNRMTGSLHKSDQARTAFISDVTHELRTPLTVIKGTIETLEDGAIDDLAARGQFLSAMGRETERLIRLVNELLLLTRADAGALNLQLHPLDLAELARSRCKHLERTAELRQVTCTVAAGSPDCQVIGDTDRLAQVLDNLLDNAIRYAPPTSQVTVTLSAGPGRVTCTVADSGLGIPAAHLPFIFERFYRVDPGRGRGQGGSGLGLAIVRGLVLAHGGQVEVHTVEGQGAAFTFWLPTAG